MVQQVETTTGEQVILAGNGALVASKSQPGMWHIVKDRTCTCAGYTYRGRCRHLAAVVDARAAKAVCTSPVFALAEKTLAGKRAS